LSYVPLITLRYVPSTPSHFRIFIMKRYQIYLKTISASSEIVMSFLCLILVICYIIYVDLWMLKIWNECNLFTIYDLFNVFLIFACKYFIEKFCIYVHQWEWSILFLSNFYLNNMFFNFLAYITCTKWIHCDIPYIYTMYPNLHHSFYHSISSPYSFIQTI
jgi:hypothetical protein